MWGVSVTFLGYFQSLDNFWGSWEEPKREIYSMGARPEGPVWWHSLKFKTVMPTHVLLTWFHFSLILHVFVTLTYTQLPWKFMDALLENFSTKFSITDFKNTSLKNNLFFFLRINMNLRTIFSVLENTSNTTPRARLEPVFQTSSYLNEN